MSALRTLLSHVVDYAGLFPPAALTMSDAVHAYDAYRARDERWMLGRFVVPASRLGELAAVQRVPNEVPNDAPWELSVLLGPELKSDVVRTRAYTHGDTRVSALELRVHDAASLAEAADSADALGVPRAATFCEIASVDGVERLADTAETHALALKLRTGGVTPDAFPAADAVVRFLDACVERRVPCKLTAGLHHPVRAEYPLTYEPGCPRGTMHGFLNVLVASALLAAGHTSASVVPLLEERDAHALAFDASDACAVQWRDLAAPRAALDVARRQLVSFGSCSFTEPVDDLRVLGLLPNA